MKYIYIMLLTIFLSNCMQQIDKKKEAEILLQTDKSFAETSIQKGAAEAFRMFLAEEAMQMSDGSEPITGRENIYKLMKPGSENYTLEWEPQFAEVSESGDLGWSWGKYKSTYETDGEQKSSYGKYLNVWKKQPDGTWKVIVDIGNKSPSPKLD